MTDLERIHFIEETFGFKLHHVPIEKLGTENKFYALPFISYIENDNFFFKGTRNYSTDLTGNVIGLSLDFSPLFLLPNNFLAGFNRLTHLSIKAAYLTNYSFLNNLNGLLYLDISGNQLTDVSFLREFKRLTSLNLEDNSLSDFSFLKEIKGLSSLNLSNNKGIKNYEFLKELKGLSLLNLSNNNLSDVSFLKELNGLTSLDLSWNVLKNVSFLKESKTLISLNLMRNYLDDISFLKELKRISSLNLGKSPWIYNFPLLRKLEKLSSLDLSDNRLADVSFLKEFKGLSILNLSSNNLCNVSFLQEFKELSSLNLSNTNLSDVSFLKELKGLSSLDLSFNNLTDVSFLKEFKGLSSLNLSSNSLKDVSFLKELKGLSSLDLSSNNLRDVSFLKEIKSLSSLYLRHNNLSDVSFLKELKGLSSLDLCGIKKIKSYTFIKELKELSSLYLGFNNLKDASFLKELKGLSTLYLGANNLRDVSFLREFKGLFGLNLNNNNLRDVSFLKELKGLFSLDLGDNPIVIPPKEVAEQGIEAIHEYFRQAEKYETEKAYEAKIMIVGEPGAGKTTLMELLFNPKHPVPSPENAQPSTLGVEVKPNRSFKNPNKDLPDIKAHIWDFGGQDIQYTLHQYFLTDDSVYVLLTDGRSGKTRYGYWFHIIGLLGKKSPVLVLLNRRKGQDTVIPFDAKMYKEMFPNLKILDVGEIDFCDLNHKWEYLKNEIANNLSKLEIVGRETLKPWKPIREAIEKLTVKHITLKEFNEICFKNGLEEERDVQFLLDYLHRIGFIQNYNDETLQNTVFLDPNWITHAIYDALSDSVIIDKNGQFHKKQLYQHWQKKECDKKHVQQYTQTECNYLLNLMQKNRFEVCYPLEGKDGYYIVPLKLPDRRPEYTFETQSNLRFRYQYPFMPEGLLSRLIVRMHDCIEDGNVWLTGVILQKKGCRAEILQHETSQEGLRYIGIRINGGELWERQRFLRDIRREVEHIHKATFPYIKFSEMVVCNCPACEKQTPNFYPYEDLQTYLGAGEKEIFCTVGKRRVDIRQMIDEVYLPEDFDRAGQKRPIEPKPEIKKKTVKIFLASSFELVEDRREFEIFINRKNKDYQKQGIFLELVIWEDFVDAISQTRLQDEYNKAIAVCDIFVSLFHTKVGKYTEEEFEVALASFRANGKPIIYTLFKDTPINISNITPEINTLLNFKQKLSELGHFPTTYSNVEDLKYKFSEQLQKVLGGL